MRLSHSLRKHFRVRMEDVEFVYSELIEPREQREVLMIAVLCGKLIHQNN